MQSTKLRELLRWKSFVRTVQTNSTQVVSVNVKKLPRPNQLDPMAELTHMYKTLMQMQHPQKPLIYFNKKTIKEDTDFKKFSGIFLVPDSLDKAVLEYMKHVSSFTYSSYVHRDGFTDITKLISDNMNNLTLNELAGILIASALFLPTHRWKQSIHCMIEKLETEMVQRIPHMSSEQVVQSMFLWFVINRKRFNEAAVVSLQEDLPALSSLDFILFCGVLGGTTTGILPHDSKIIQRILLRHVDTYTMEQLGVIAAAFFRSQQFISNQILLSKIWVNLGKSLPGVSAVPLSSLLKLLRKSFNVFYPSHSEMCKSLYQILEVHVDRLHPYMLTQVILLGSNCMVHSEKILTYTTNRFLSNLASVRLKDLERLLFCLVTYQYDTAKNSGHTQTIINDLRTLRRQEEGRQHPDSLLSALYYLASLGCFPQDLMEHLAQVSGQGASVTRPIDLCWLDLLHKIYNPAYDPTLFAECLQKLKKDDHINENTQEATKSSTESNQMFLLIKSVLADCLGGHQFVCQTSIIPLATIPDLVFCIDGSGKPVAISDQYQSLAGSELKYPYGSGLRWFSVKATNTRSFLHDSAKLRGAMLLVKDVHKEMGYKTCHISANQYHSLRSQDEKTKMIKSTIAGEFQLKKLFNC